MERQQPDFLTLLYEQHRFYTGELGRTHHGLGKLYKKLTRFEHALAEHRDGQNHLSNKDKKKVQWSCSVPKVTISKLEMQRATQHEYLMQCNELIASYESQNVYPLPAAPWPVRAPSSPALFTYATARPQPRPHRPQYCHLSMLSERRQSSPYAPSADSGFHEPPIYGQPFVVDSGRYFDPDHIFAHEMMSPPIVYGRVEASASQSSSISERDDLPELFGSLMSPATKLGANGPSSPHKRRYSEFSIRVLTTPETVQRGSSVGPATSRGSSSSSA